MAAEASPDDSAWQQGKEQGKDMQIRVQLLGVERRITKHIYDFLELNFGPFVKINVYHGIICM